MNIRYIKTNIANTSQDTLIKLLSNMILENINNVNDFNVNTVYKEGDRVYLEENGKHHIYQCIVNNSSGLFDKNNWIHIIEVYRGPAPTFYAIKVKEEVHTITQSTVNGCQINLEFDKSNSTIAIYHGKKRLVRDYDFTINSSNYITFTEPLKVGCRIIVEVREKLGVEPSVGVVFYDLAGVPYNCSIADNGSLYVSKISTTDPVKDVKQAQLVTGDHTYTMLVDSSVNPPVLGVFKDINQHITGTDGKIYRLSITNEVLTMTEDPTGFSDVKIIMGSDRKFYTLGLVNGNIVPTIVNDETLKVSDFEIGFKMLTNEFKNRMIDVKNGNVRVVKYIRNGGYHNILLKSKNSSKIARLTVTEDLALEIHDNLNGTGTHTSVLDEFYFYDDNWNYHVLYYENDEIFYDIVNTESIIPDSRGINILTPSGETCKLVLSTEDDLKINKIINLSNVGTFSSPLDKGYVIMHNGTKKLITINRAGTSLEVKDAPNDMVFRTNHHYIMSSTGILYKILYNGINVNVEQCDVNDYEIESANKGSFIEANQIVSKIDVVNNGITIEPISTFTHTVQSDDGRFYLMDIIGDKYNENISFTEIDQSQILAQKLGVGKIYLKNELGECFAGRIEKDELVFKQIAYDDSIDYNVTSMIYSAKGWYRFVMSGDEVNFTKTFDNLYTPDMCFGNIVKKDYIMTSSNRTEYSLYASGNGELSVRKARKDDTKSAMLRSSDGRTYCIGLENDRIVTYESFVAPRNGVPHKLYIKDIVTNVIHALYIEDSRLATMAVDTPPIGVKNEIVLYDVYQDSRTAVFVNGKLTILTPLEGIISSTGDYYRTVIGDNLDVSLLQFNKIDESQLESINKGYIQVKDTFTGISYDGFVNNGTIEFTVNRSNNYSPEQIVVTNKGLFAITITNGHVEIVSLIDLYVNYIDVVESPTGEHYMFIEQDGGLGIQKIENISGKISGTIVIKDLTNSKKYQSYVNGNVLELRSIYNDKLFNRARVRTSSGNIYEFIINDGVIGIRKV